LAYPTALTVAGSDSGGGAGIQADLKTFLDHGVFGMSAITAITAQNSRGVHRVDLVPPAGLRAQLDAVFDDFPVGCVKVGMLATAEHARVLAEVLRALGPSRPPVVLDPVLVSSTGHRLTSAETEVVVRDELLPLATVATPNTDELRVLAGDADPADWARAAPCPVLWTGGDLVGDTIVDQLFRGAHVRRWAHPRLGTLPFHGTGCTLASAIAARLARGATLEDAVDHAITYVIDTIAAWELLGSIGRGNPSLPHGLARWR
jgi:hydroxymethylpyrimidine kinase/phosphomethylpyrimidine kinase